VKLALAFAAAICAASPFATPSLSHARVAPDSVVAAAVQSGRWNRFRVSTSRSTFELTTLRADSLGVRLDPGPRRPAIVAPDASPDRERILRWSDVEHVDASRTHAMRGAVEGAIVGGIVGVSIAFLVGTSIHDESAVGALTAVPLGVVFGALAGSGFWGRGRWTRIYPPVPAPVAKPEGRE